MGDSRKMGFSNGELGLELVAMEDISRTEIRKSLAGPIGRPYS
jgi:hypothetical protein